LHTPVAPASTKSQVVGSGMVTDLQNDLNYNKKQLVV